MSLRKVPLKYATATGILCIVVFLTSIAGIWTARLTNQRQRDANVRQWNEQISSFAELGQDALFRIDLASLDHLVQGFSTDPDVLGLRIYAFGARLVAQTDGFETEPANAYHQFRILHDRDGMPIGRLEVFLNGSILEIWSPRALITAVAYLLLLTISIGAGSFLLISVLTGQIARLHAAVQHFELGVWQPLKPRGPKELAELSIVLNEMAERITKDATTDPITGIFNRRGIESSLKDSLERNLPADRPVGVLMIDLDYFKRINDSFGHLAGDEVLTTIAGRIAHNIGHAGTAGRFAGDEFLIVIDNPAMLEDLDATVDELMRAIEVEVRLDCSNIHMRASVGSAFAPRDGWDVQSLLQAADVALYRAKNAGRRRYVAFSPAFREQSQMQLSRENWLRETLIAGTIAHLLQPIVNTVNCRLWGVESLLRAWPPEPGITMSTPEFIALAEELGFCRRLTDITFFNACNHIKAMNAAGLTHEKLTINLSVNQLLRTDVVSSLQETCAMLDVSHDRLVIEVTEEAYLSQSRIIDNLNQLNQLGFELALDDFGSGYASISCIRDIPFSIVKVDKSLTNNVPKQLPACQLLEGALDFASHLQLTTIVEGIETYEQFQFVQNVGCDLCQGYYFGRPGSVLALDKKKFIFAS